MFANLSRLTAPADPVRPPRPMPDMLPERPTALELKLADPSMEFFDWLFTIIA